MQNLKLFYSLFVIFSLLIFSYKANCTTHEVGIGNNFYTPSNFSASVGDTVKWTLNAGVHTTTSSTVPTGADSWDSGVMTSGNTYTYVIQVAGDYTYFCTIHGSGMSGTFTATGTSSVEPISGITPVEFNLQQNYPNPFNPATKINFSIPNSSKVTLKVYDVLGNVISTLLSNEYLTANSYSVNFDAKNLTSGIYFYTLEADNFIDTKKMLLVK